jgi:sirohydrochlorin ferrochelatase
LCFAPLGYGPRIVTMKRALILVDHGSRREEASAFLDALAALVRARAPGMPVHIAHLEIAPPTIASAVRACAHDHAEEITVVPCFLAAGRHVLEDVPRLVEEAVRTHAPDVAWKIAEPLGAHPLIAELVCLRANLV